MEEKELTKRQLKAVSTKNKIFNTAIALMERKGYDNITIDEISKAAGVSVGAFYHHFKSKSDIFYEMYKKADDFFNYYVPLQLQEEDAVSRIIEYFVIYAEYNMAAGIDKAKILYNSENKLFIKKGRYMQLLLQEIIREGQKNNRISADESPEEICECLFIAVRGIVYDWCLHDGGYDLAAKIKIFVTRLITTFEKKTHISPLNDNPLKDTR